MDIVAEFTSADEKGRWGLSVNCNGDVLEEGLYIESSLILSMHVPEYIICPALKSAIFSNPLM
jgi:hypothetical protein